MSSWHTGIQIHTRHKLRLGDLAYRKVIINSTNVGIFKQFVRLSFRRESYTRTDNSHEWKSQ